MIEKQLLGNGVEMHHDAMNRLVIIRIPEDMVLLKYNSISALRLGTIIKDVKQELITKTVRYEARLKRNKYYMKRYGFIPNETPHH